RGSRPRSRRAAQQGFTVLQGNCFTPDRSHPYAPLIDLLRAMCVGCETAALAALIGPIAPELARLLPDLTLRLPDVTVPVPPDSDATGHRLPLARARLRPRRQLLSPLAGFGPHHRRPAGRRAKPQPPGELVRQHPAAGAAVRAPRRGARSSPGTRPQPRRTPRYRIENQPGVQHSKPAGSDARLTRRLDRSCLRLWGAAGDARIRRACLS